MTQEKDELDLFQVFGRTGLKNYSGIVNEEFLEQLKHEKGTRMYREMAENDAIIGAILYAIKTLVRQVDWRIDAAEDTDDARAVADFVSECLFEDMDRTWTDTLSEILSFLVYGFSVHEITYKIRRGPDEELKTRSIHGTSTRMVMSSGLLNSLRRTSLDATSQPRKFSTSGPNLTRTTPKEGLSSETPSFRTTIKRSSSRTNRSASLETSPGFRRSRSRPRCSRAMRARLKRPSSLR